MGIDGNVSEDSKVDMDIPVHYVKADLNVLYTSLAARLEQGYKLEELELVNFELPTQEIYDLLTNAVEKLIDIWTTTYFGCDFFSARSRFRSCRGEMMRQALRASRKAFDHGRGM